MPNPSQKRLGQLFGFLDGLNQVRNQPIKAIGDQPWVISFQDLPDHPSIERAAIVDVEDEPTTATPAAVVAEEVANDFVLKVSRPELTNAPTPPDSITFAIPWQIRQATRQFPPIHDITTDIQYPPRFVDVLPLRKDAPNSVDYTDTETPARQRAAYPDILPLDLTIEPAAAFERAERAAREMGWQVVTTNSAEGRLEATATTFWFGFKDDVVVRIRPRDTLAAGCRVDIRSVSRVGRGDAGANAKRIKTFLARIREVGQ